MLIGEYRHTIDSKKRVSLPATFRKGLGKRMVLTRGLDNCAFIYPTKEWNRVSQKIQELSMGQADTRGFSRYMLSGASETTIDSLGRILIPEPLRKTYKLHDKVVLIGVNDHVEVWNERTWDTYRRRIEKRGDELAEKLGEIGVI